MPEWRKSFEAEDSDFGGVPWKCVLPLKWVPQAHRIWERETTDPKPTKAKHPANQGMLGDDKRRTRMVPFENDSKQRSLD
jgi:hypothetical protein